MKNKLLISMALLTAGIAAASCEKTPSGEFSADAQNQSGSATSARQHDGAAQQQAQDHPDQSAGQAARTANEQQSKQGQHEQEAQDRNNGDKQNQSSQSQEQWDQRSAQAQDQNNKAKDGEAQQSEPTQQDRANAQSPSSAQSDRAALQQGQTQPNQPQQNQAQQNEPQQNQPQQNKQAGVGAADGTVHLGPEQIRQAQMVLKQKGFDVGLVDGIMGPRTRKAVTAFQQQQGLQATGQIDQRTVTALGMATGSGQQDNLGRGSSTAGHGGTQ